MTEELVGKNSVYGRRKKEKGILSVQPEGLDNIMSPNELTERKIVQRTSYCMAW